MIRTWQLNDIEDRNEVRQITEDSEGHRRLLLNGETWNSWGAGEENTTERLLCAYIIANVAPDFERSEP